MPNLVWRDPTGPFVIINKWNQFLTDAPGLFVWQNDIKHALRFSALPDAQHIANHLTNSKSVQGGVKCFDFSEHGELITTLVVKNWS